MAARDGADGGTGIARRRRERRLRSVVAEARAAVDRSGPGNGDPPLLRQGGHRERRSTEPEDSHQDRERGGVRGALYGYDPEDSSPASCSHSVLPDDGRRGW